MDMGKITCPKCRTTGWVQLEERKSGRQYVYVKHYEGVVGGKPRMRRCYVGPADSAHGSLVLLAGSKNGPKSRNSEVRFLKIGREERIAFTVKVIETIPNFLYEPEKWGGLAYARIEEIWGEIKQAFSWSQGGETP